MEDGRFDEALVLLRVEAEDADAEFGGASFEAAVAWNRVGVASKFAGRFADAAAAYARVQPVAEALEETEPELMLALLHNLGGLAHSEHRYEDAEPLARRGLELRRRVSDDAEAIAADVAALAAIIEGQERWEEAEALYREALELWTAIGDRYAIAMTMNGLAAVVRFSGRPEEAHPIFVEALAILEDERGSDHPQTATVRNNLAMLLNAMDRSQEALVLLRQAAADLLDRLGPDHPATLDVQGNIGRVETKIAASAAG